MAAIYARVSSVRQKEEQTIASQTAALRAHAAANGLEVPPEWVFEDDGYSGATLIRPALERLRDLAAEVGTPVVLCYAPDRLARRYVYQTLLIEEFARVGTEVRFVQGRRTETAEDELLLQFQGMIAEYERAQIAERTRRGKLHRARSGSPAVLSGAPYGYRYVRKSEDADARYEIVESEATVVRELFRLYIDEQQSIGGLVRWLYAQAIPTATGKAIWDRSTIWGMLRNPAYYGQAAFGKTRETGERPKVTRPLRKRGARLSGRFATRDCARDQWTQIAVPPIVSEETFELAARRLEDNKRFASRRTKEPSLLQGLVACQSCGYSYYRTSTRTSKRKLYYYRCLGADDYRYQGGRVCRNRPVRQDYLDELVWSHVTALLADPQLIRAEIERRLQELRTTSPIAARKGSLQNDLRRTERAMHRLVEAYQEELIELEELRRRSPELRRKATALRGQLEALEAQAVDRETYLRLAENLGGFLTRLRNAAETVSIPERQRILRLLVREVLVGPERVVIRHSITGSRPGTEGGYPMRGRSHHPTLWSADQGLLYLSLVHRPGAQPLADEPQHARVSYPPRDELHQKLVVQRVEVALEIQVDHLVVAEGHPLADIVDCLLCATLRTKPVRPLAKARLKQRLDHDSNRRLDDAISNPWNAQRPLPPIGLPDENPTYRLRPVALPSQLLA